VKILRMFKVYIEFGIWNEIILTIVIFESIEKIYILDDES